MAAPPPGSITVTQLSALIKSALQRGLPTTLQVAGELSNVSRPASGHVYFTLKDSGSEVRCAMWRSSAAAMRFAPMDGLAVLATGAVDMYEPRGQVQLIVRRLEPVGVGALELAFRQLRERLGKEGLFDPARKRPLPAFPRRIAIVTSPTGAAIRDMLQTISRRYPCVTVLLFPVRVQGTGAAAEIAAAINAISVGADSIGGVDVLIAGRGGGSLEDLWCFNEEVVARAIYACTIPVVSAVGHETDVSIADLTADVRAATPTAAAELVVPVRLELLAHLDQTAARLRRALRHLLDALAARLARSASTELLRDPRGYVERRAQRVDEYGARLQGAAARRLAALGARLHAAEVALWRHRPEAVLARRRERLLAAEYRLRWAQGHTNLLGERRLEACRRALMAASPTIAARRLRVLLDQLGKRLAHASHESVIRGAAKIDSLAARLDASDYHKVLARGFSITRDKSNKSIIRNPAMLRAGDRIITQTAQGEFTSRVVDGRQGELFE